MISLHYYLDTRATAPGSPAPLKLGIGKRQRTAYIQTGIVLLPSEWDGKLQRVVKHPRHRILNSDLARLKAQTEDYLRPLLYNGELADLSATQIKDLVNSHFYGQITSVKLWDIYKVSIGAKGAGTGIVYRSSWERFLKWKPDGESLSVRSFTKGFVAEFCQWLEDNYKPNTANITLRCFQSVWNDAERQGKASGNPFAGVKPAPAQTHGRDLTLCQIRALWRIVPQSEREAQALDFFKLSFLLRAINPVDLLRVSPADISNGRLYYNRQKTGKAISAKIEPEAVEIIGRRGNARHLFAVSCKADSFKTAANNALRTIAKREGLPPVTMYYARHTLASLLFERGGTMDTVSAILSHTLGGARITATYVAVREARLDDAMRGVIDAIIR